MQVINLDGKFPKSNIPAQFSLICAVDIYMLRSEGKKTLKFFLFFTVKPLCFCNSKKILCIINTLQFIELSHLESAPRLSLEGLSSATGGSRCREPQPNIRQSSWNPVREGKEGL